MRMLAYTCVYDSPEARAINHEMAYVAMDSLRVAGHGCEALVLGSGSDAARWKDEFSRIGVTYMEHFHPDWSCRFVVPREAPEVFAGFDRILYMDNDCILLRSMDEWNDRLDSLGERYGAIVCDTPTNMRSGKGFGGNISRKIVGGGLMLGVCAGHLLVTGKAAPDLFRQWNAAYGFAVKRKGFRITDQSALNRVILDSETGGVFSIPYRFARFPSGDIAILSVFSRYGGHVEDHHVMVHYNMKGKSVRLARMSAHLEHIRRIKGG